MLDDDDLAVWVAGLDDLFALVAGRFPRVEPRLQARAYVRGLLAPLAVKNGWTLAEAAGNKTPDKMQRLLNRASWDAGGVRDDVRGYVITAPGRRRRGAGGGRDRVRQEGGQVGGGAAAVLGHRRAGGELPAGRVRGLCVAERPRAGRPGALPAEIVDGRPGRCREAGVPDDVQFASKPELARLMLGRALDAGVPAAWVTADEAYGKDGKFRDFLEQRRIGYVVAVAANQAVRGDAGTSRADVLAAHAPARHGSAAAAATAPKAPGSTTGRPRPCPPTAPSRPAGPGTCSSAAR